MMGVSKSWILKGVFASFALASILGGMFFYKPDLFPSNKTGKLIAKVAGDNIYEPMIDSMIQSEIGMYEKKSGKKFEIQQEQKAMMRSQMLDTLINEKLLSKFAGELNLDVEDSFLIEQLKKIPVFLGDNGLFDINKFNEYLGQINMSEKEYIKEMKIKLLTFGIFSAFNRSYVNLNSRTDIFMKNAMSDRIVTILRLKMNDFEKEIAAKNTDENARKFFDDENEYFTIPEFRKIDYIKVNESSIKNIHTIEEKDLEERAKERWDEMSDEKKERRDFASIVCKDENDAQDLRSYILSAKIGFENYIKKMGEIEREVEEKKCFTIQMDDKTSSSVPSEIRDKVFKDLVKTKDGFVSQTFKTDLGFHVLILKNIHHIDMSEIKQEIKDEMMQNNKLQALQEKIEELKNEIEDKKYKDLKEVAMHNTFTIETKDFINKNGIDLSEILKRGSGEYEDDGSKIQKSHILINEDTLDNIFNAQEGSINLIKSSEYPNTYIIYNVSSIRAAQKKDFDKEKNAIKEMLKEKYGNEIVIETMAKIKDALKDGMELKLLKERFPQIIIDKDVLINGTVFNNPNLLQALALPDEFLKKILINYKDKIIGPDEFGYDSVLAIRSGNKEMPAGTLKKEEIDKLSQSINYNIFMSESNEVLSEIIKYLKGRYKVKIYN